MLTRVCRLHAAHDLRVETVETPDPAPGEVLVAVQAGGICGSDLHYFHDGGFGPVRVREPIVLGHEAAGTVIAVTEGVTGLAPGDRVALSPSQPCGSCRFCTAGQFQHCLTMRFRGSAMRFPHEQGMFRDRLAIGAAQCHRLADSVPFAEAALAEPLAVCLHAVARAQAIHGSLQGARVLVTGAGPIGALCLLLARHFGAAEVVVTDIQDATLAKACALGADHALNTATDPEALAPWQADKGQFDVVFECSAAAPAVRAAIAAVRPQGTIVQVGVTGDMAIPLNLIVGKEIALAGTHRFHPEFADAVALINAGALNLAPLVSHSFALEQAAEAFAVASDRTRSVKVQLTFAGA